MGVCLLDVRALVQGAALMPEGQVDEHVEGRATPRTSIVGVDVTDVAPDQQGKEVSHAMVSELAFRALWMDDLGPLDVSCSSLLDLICVISGRWGSIFVPFLST